MNKYIITGGPGSGKTNLLEALKSMGYNCSNEVSRRVIKREVEKKSACLPWLNLACFADKVLSQMVASYNAAPGDKLTFYDRGVPDIIAYLKVAGLPIADNYYTALQQCPYNKTVFILPPWPEIYINDDERWQTYQQAEEIYLALMETYTAFGFKLITVPKLTVNNRAAFIINNMNSTLTNQHYNVNHAQ